MPAERFYAASGAAQVNRGAALILTRGEPIVTSSRQRSLEEQAADSNTLLSGGRRAGGGRVPTRTMSSVLTQRCVCVFVSGL